MKICIKPTNLDLYRHEVDRKQLLTMLILPWTKAGHSFEIVIQVRLIVIAGGINQFRYFVFIGLLLQEFQEMLKFNRVCKSFRADPDMLPEFAFQLLFRYR